MNLDSETPNYNNGINLDEDSDSSSIITPISVENHNKEEKRTKAPRNTTSGIEQKIREIEKENKELERQLKKIEESKAKQREEKVKLKSILNNVCKCIEDHIVEMKKGNELFKKEFDKFFENRHIFENIDNANKCITAIDDLKELSKCFSVDLLEKEYHSVMKPSSGK
ncbi:hypothetical protein QTN25_002560 [Entamoeba marina]